MVLLLGGNSPVQGFTDRGRAAAEVLGPGVMLWVSSASPRDGIRYPDCVHLLRCRNWGPQEDADAYANSLSDYVTPWRSAIPGIVLILGNEPDLEVSHHGERIGAMAAAVKRRFPGVRVGNPPLSVEKTSEIYAEGCDVVTCHSYFERQHPESMGDLRFGKSYTYAQTVAGRRSVYVSEFNVVQTNCPIYWPDRNKQAAAWLDQAEADGVAGVCLFILDAAPDWSSFDIGSESAAEILALRHQTPPAPPPPQPAPIPSPTPPEEPTMPYTRDSDPRGYRPLYPGWRPFIAAHNPMEADAICTAYDDGCRVIGYDANCAVAQGCVETAVFTSPRWVGAKNAAGIGIYADSTPDVQFGTAERGVRAQIELLSDYYGDGTEPWGILRGFGFGGMRLGKTTLRGLDGVWAADTGYSAAIVRYLNQVMGGQPAPAPVPVPTPVPSPVQQYRFIAPVDDAIGQGSLGTYSHGGRVAGFFAVDFMSARGTPCRATANGTVTEKYTGDWNARSARTGPSLFIAHANGYASFYCHLSRMDVGIGDTVAQGQVIGLTGDPAIDGGFGSGAHLHFEAWLNGTRIKWEGLLASGDAGPWNGAPPPTPTPAPSPPAPDGYSHPEVLRMWFGGKTDAEKADPRFVYHDGWGIETAYDDALNGRHPQFPGTPYVLGEVLSDEEGDPGTPGRSVRYYSAGKITAIRQADGSYVTHIN